MASYLDYLFPMAQSNPSITGLLGEEEAKKIRQQSQISGLLNFGANLLANSGPTSQPMSFGQRLAPALLGGYQAAQGATNQQLQDQLTMQKLQKEQAFNKAVQGSFVNRPVGTGLTQTGKGSQAELLSRPEFGGDFAAKETISGLQSNVNLPQKQVLDQEMFMSALAQYNPLEFAKMQMTAQKDTSPSKIKEFAAFQAMPEDQKRAYIQMQTLMNPPATTTFIDKGPNELRQLDAKEISALSGKVSAAREFANTAGAIENLLTGLGGGQPVAVGAEVAQFLGINSKTADANALAKALQTRAATQVRAAGSGSTSDLEFKSFLSVFPSLGNTEQGRTLMSKGLRAFAERDAKIEAKARELFGKNEYSAGALAAYDASLGPVLDPKEFSAMKPSGSTGTPRRDLRQPANK
jgi:hypothetical protein